MFILGDLIVFGLFFVTFVVYRSWQPELYAASQMHMNQMFGVVNTILLLSSSWAVASALQRAKAGLPYAPALLGLAVTLGVGFGVVKVFEYREKLRTGIELNTNEFYTFYYMFTGIHLLHVMMGVGVLVYLSFIAKKSRLAADDIRTLEGGASFWHLVDILWIVLFALFYLMR
ncbi:cytochrome c oxidase polypeptide III [Sphingobium fuliginis]|uniref:Cytochrome c oxidase polypeptide III n=1 Tax=Sphingobium fuliginis (strain ATCC 27551) TaxID=336203 RepID=A0A292ZH86_SPHSA|nr:cytochrome c oxidase polypeptide III [Sphingobium fuliginis]